MQSQTSPSESQQLLIEEDRDSGVNDKKVRPEPLSDKDRKEAEDPMFKGRAILDEASFCNRIFFGWAKPFLEVRKLG